MSTNKEKLEIYKQRYDQVMKLYKETTDPEVKNRCLYTIMELEKFIKLYSDSPEEEEIISNPNKPIPSILPSDNDLIYMFVPMVLLSVGIIAAIKFF